MCFLVHNCAGWGYLVNGYPQGNGIIGNGIPAAIPRQSLVLE